MTEPVIETEGLTKRYNGTTAVDQLDLEIRSGEIFGLLGPNGAGKTTTILMLLGLTEPTSGQARVLGIDSSRGSLEIKRRVSYLPDNVGFYQEMSGYQNLTYTARLNGIDEADARERLLQLLDQVGLPEVAHEPVSTYSHGMRQRLGLAEVLIKNPEIIILDEPTNGLDPEGTDEFLQFFRHLSRDQGRTLLVSSHLLRQMQSVCDRVGLFVDGRLEAVGPVDQLGKQLLKGDRMVIEVQTDAEPEQAAGRLAEMEGVSGVDAGDATIAVHAAEDIRADINRNLAADGITVTHMRLRGAGLNDIYLRYFRGERDDTPAEVD